jgi:hypothetical protein
MRRIVAQKNKEPCTNCIVLPVCLRKKTCFELLTQCVVLYKHIVYETGIFKDKYETGIFKDKIEADVEIFHCIYVSPNFKYPIRVIRHKRQRQKDGIQAFFMKGAKNA